MWLWIIGGVNGAGKTTLTTKDVLRVYLGDIDIIDPDERTREIRQKHPSLTQDDANLRAAQETEDEVRQRIERRDTFGVETVLSSDKYKPYVSRARTLGYQVGLIYVALSSPLLAIERVRTRVQAGGHNVAPDKVKSRWERSMANMPWFASRSDMWVVVCNDSPFGEAILIAYGKHEAATILAPSLVPGLTRLLQGMTQAPRA